MNKIIWFFKQLFPLTYWSLYRDEQGHQYVAIWKMWFGKIYKHSLWEVKPCDNRYLHT